MPRILADLRAALNNLDVTESVVLVGHSFGGAIATEYASAYTEMVSHLILIATAGEFGRKARVPILWLSAENNSYFGPELSKRMVEAFRGAGGRAKFHLLPPVGDDGHRMISTPEAVATWGPIVEKFLRTAR